MKKLLIDYCSIAGTDLFTSEPYFSPEQSRIFGYKDSKRQGLALYPASLPSAYYVLDDLEIIFGDVVEWTPAALKQREYIETARESVRSLTLPEEPGFVTTPFSHQFEAVVRGFWEHRFGIFHDMGLGKTKTMIDILRMVAFHEPESVTLVVCPPHLMRNWQREISVHSRPGEFRLFAMCDDTNKSLDVDRRMAFYTGRNAVEPAPDGVYATEYPRVFYEALPPGLPEEVYEIEREYVHAIDVGDAKARGKHRTRLRYRAKKYGFELTEGAWRRIEPVTSTAQNTNVLLVSYDVLVADADLLLEYYPFNIIACDESHNLQSTKSARTKSVLRLSLRARRRYLLSGTPSLGDPIHLYPQLKFFSPALAGSYHTFDRRFRVRSKYNERMVVGFKNLDVLNMIVNDVTSRKKQDECVDLPERRFITIEVPPNNELSAQYNSLVANWDVLLEGDKTVEVQHATDRLNKLLQVLSGFYTDSNKDPKICDQCPFVMGCAEEKIKPYTTRCEVVQVPPKKTVVRFKDAPRVTVARDLIRDILQDPVNKLIIWCTYTEEIDIVAEILKEEGIQFVRVDGKTKDKVACEDRFREDAACKVYLSHVSISEGLTLNSANYTLYYGLTYNLKHYEQSLKRNERIGQTRKTTVYHMVTPGSVHEYVLSALEAKKDTAETMTDAIHCATCEYVKECAAKQVRPFEPGCIYETKKERVVTRPDLI